MLLGALAASILGNALVGKRVTRAGEGIIRIVRLLNTASSIK